MQPFVKIHWPLVIIKNKQIIVRTKHCRALLRVKRCWWYVYMLNSVDVGSRMMILFVLVAKTHRLTTLRTILTTGSPLKPQLFDFVYNDIKSDVLLGSITGGTDIMGAFAGNSVLLPVFRGEIQSPHLGCAVESWSEEGMHVHTHTHGNVVLLLK